MTCRLKAKRFILRTKFAPLWILSSATAQGAYAQAAPPQSGQPIGPAQSQFEQENRARELQRNLSQQPPAASQDRPKLEPEENAGACRLIDRITVDNVTLISPARLAKAVGPFRNKCLSLKDIDVLRESIYNAYSDAGYALVQIYIGPQDLSGKELILTMVEGQVERYEIRKNDKVRRGSNTAFLTKQGDPFKLRRYEQGLDIVQSLQTYRRIGTSDTKIVKSAPIAVPSQAAALPGTFAPPELPGSPPLPTPSVEPSANRSEATPSEQTISKPPMEVEIAPGERVGTSVITVNTYQPKPFYAIVGTDDYGSASTGRTRINAGIGVEDVLGAYESLAIRGSHTTDFSKDADRSRNIAGDFSIPYGYWNLRLSGSYFDYRAAITTANQVFVTKGNQRDYSADLDRIVYRDKANVLKFGVGLAIRDVHNFVNGLKLDSSSRRLALLNAKLSERGRLFGSAVFAEFDFTRGLAAFGALHDGLLDKELPHAQFSRITGSFDLQHVFYLEHQSDGRPGRSDGHPGNLIQLHSYVTQSWSPYALYGTEKVQIGGPFTVRGFADTALVGDVGGFSRNELSFIPELNVKGALAQVFGQPSIYAGIDAGWIIRDYGDPTLEHSIAGAVAGLRFDAPHFRTEARVEAPIARPSMARHQGVLFRFSVSAML